MGLLGSMVGGAIGAELTQLATAFIAQQGGVQGVVEKFEKSGLGGIAQSWVGNGANKEVSPDQISEVLGSDAVKLLAAKAGFTPDQLATKLAEFLPGTIDKMTPNGKTA
jgi:uncharacterized protein YidB (DUF937 family)